MSEIATHDDQDRFPQILRMVEAMILDGELAPGDRLNELVLSHRLKVSRAPIREVVRRLERMGLVQVVPRRGVVVRRIELPDAMHLYDLRAALFRMAGRLACARARPEALRQLEALQAQMIQAAAEERSRDYYDTNLEFHSALLAAAGNPPLAETYEEAVKRLHLFRARSLVSPHQFEVSLREHDRILVALTKRDPDAAGRACERHILLGRQRMLDTLPSGRG